MKVTVFAGSMCRQRSARVASLQFERPLGVIGGGHDDFALVRSASHIRPSDGSPLKAALCHKPT
jgi:hypothetical protein